jgi:FAD/FMN-containing dehydrogenase
MAATSSSTASVTLTDCLGSKDVPIKLTSDSDWNTYVVTYNTRLQNTPQVIVIPETQQQIQDAVVCAAASNVAVQAKCGGHSYSSYSTPEGGLQIDLENFQDVSVDSDGVATVGAGIRLGNLATAIYNQGQRALSHGTCPGVGIGMYSFSISRYPN